MTDDTILILAVVVLTGLLTWAVDHTGAAGPVKLLCKIAFVLASAILVAYVFKSIGIWI